MLRCGLACLKAHNYLCKFMTHYDRKTVTDRHSHERPICLSLYSCATDKMSVKIQWNCLLIQKESQLYQHTQALLLTTKKPATGTLKHYFWLQKSQLPAHLGITPDYSEHFNFLLKGHPWLTSLQWNERRRYLYFAIFSDVFMSVWWPHGLTRVA